MALMAGNKIDLSKPHNLHCKGNVGCEMTSVRIFVHHAWKSNIEVDASGILCLCKMNMGNSVDRYSFNKPLRMASHVLISD